MITDSFEPKNKAIMSPADFYGEQKHICDICIVILSIKIYEKILSDYECELIANISACNGKTPIYTFKPFKDEQGESVKTAFYLSHIGATLAGTDVIEANWFTGATKFIMFGSAGSLDATKTTGKYVVPTEAYRDEGMSYHYAPPSNYISISGCKKVAEVFEQIKVPYVCGKAWTTDAFYRETKEALKKRTDEGCIAVDMELSGVQAVCDFHGFSLYDFLVTGDVLDSPEYDKSGLYGANHSLDKLYLAFEIARRI